MITVAMRPSYLKNFMNSDKPDYLIVNWRVTGRSHIWQPPTDLLEVDDGYLVRVEIAGMDEKDFEISLDQQTLVIQGSRADTLGQRVYHQMEVNFGDFFTMVELPSPVDPSRATAEYQNGFLLIRLPKTPVKHIRISE
ncbi:Hsp20/alpha crystallin family protein [Anaerolinea sp.]|uniref:Hsp20/alpha crystallin family protein n=1 Tax=Anaerolinea sp. TaxID=1872519 RepID=UPI002ACF01B8|nr:Hsp20/alpha crystallin family protein [Anaerolinea sp.]